MHRRHLIEAVEIRRKFRQRATYGGQVAMESFSRPSHSDVCRRVLAEVPADGQWHFVAVSIARTTGFEVQFALDNDSSASFCLARP
jgi:hypothetical protein